MALLTVEGAINDVAGVGECRRQLPVEVGIVLDDEETHGSSLRGCDVFRRGFYNRPGLSPARSANDIPARSAL
jgi:hypothetical protein